MLFRGQRLRFKCDGPTKFPMKFVSLEKEPTTNGRRKKRSEKKKNVCTREIKRKNTDATAKVSQFRERNLVECYLYSKRVRKRTTSSLVIRFEAILCVSLSAIFFCLDDDDERFLQL